MPILRTSSSHPFLAAQDVEALPAQTFDTEFGAGPFRLTLSHFVRGADAAARIAQASDQNDPPADGIDYLLFFVEATNSGTQRTWIDYDDFAVFGSSGVVRRSLELMPPDPPLRAALDPGQSTSGWVVGAIEASDASPAIVFDSRILSGSWADRVITTPGGSPPAIGARSQTADATGTDPAAPATLDQPLVTADWVVVVRRAIFGQEVYDLSDFRTQAVGSSDPSLIPLWVAVEVEVTNNRTGSAIAHLPATAFALAWADGSEILDVARLTPPTPDISGDYLPGATRTGWFAFERPPDFSGSLLRFQPYRTDPDVRYLTWADGAAPANPQGSDAPNVTPVPPAEPFAAGDTVTTIEADVNLRAQPSTSADIVEPLPLGTTLVVTGDPVEADGYTWYPVDDPATGRSGYVAANFLRASG